MSIPRTAADLRARTNSFQPRTLRPGLLQVGMSGSAFFQRVRKSLQAARTRAASASAPREVFAFKALARATPGCAHAPVQQFQTMPLWLRIF